MSIPALRVRWGEVDAQGVVFNPNYLMYADVAVTEFMRARGVIGSEESEFSELFVVDAHISFHASARFDELLDFTVKPVKIGSSSFTLEVIISRADTKMTTIRIIYVRVVHDKPTALSDAFKTNLLAKIG